MASITFPHTSQLPAISALYSVVVNNAVMYVGQTKNLRNRWNGHIQRQFCESLTRQGLRARIHWWEISAPHRQKLERRILRQFYIPNSKDSRAPTFAPCGQEHDEESICETCRQMTYVWGYCNHLRTQRERQADYSTEQAENLLRTLAELKADADRRREAIMARSQITLNLLEELIDQNL